MRLAFCLYKYFPYGGLERDFLRIAECCCQRGHDVYVYTRSWEGEVPSGFKLTLVPVEGYTNHGLCASFVRRVRPRLLEERFDAVIGFNHMPGLDVYYAADVCFKAHAHENHGLWYRFTPRYRVYSALEESVFSPESRTEILLISEKEKSQYIQHYCTQESRFHFLPPGVSRDCRPPAHHAVIRSRLRREFSIGEDQNLVLMVGSNYKKKGFDRTLEAIASLPRGLKENTHLFVVGRQRRRAWLAWSRLLGLFERVTFVGERNDVPRFLLGADLLMHPASRENTGTVIVEALVAGLPVLATDVCGYATHVERAGSGLLVPSPYRQADLNRKLAYMLTAPERESWRRNALAYTARTDLFSLADRAADTIESIVRENAAVPRL
ncbi:MAG: glycosyltransferase family 4 protein [Planctomycetes bacterium]|nr:glycosyltransferase family 4 protein [Planctomycetota bacterium]